MEQENLNFLFVSFICVAATRFNGNKESELQK